MYLDADNSYIKIINTSFIDRLEVHINTLVKKEAHIILTHTPPPPPHTHTPTTVIKYGNINLR